MTKFIELKDDCEPRIVEVISFEKMPPGFYRLKNKELLCFGEYWNIVISFAGMGRMKFIEDNIGNIFYYDSELTYLDIIVKVYELWDIKGGNIAGVTASLEEAQMIVKKNSDLAINPIDYYIDEAKTWCTDYKIVQEWEEDLDDIY